MKKKNIPDFAAINIVEALQVHVEDLCNELKHVPFNEGEKNLDWTVNKIKQFKITQSLLNRKEE